MESLKGKVIVITGASAGIGAATAVTFIKYGAKVVIHGRNEQSLNAVIQRCVDQGAAPDDVVSVQGDLKDDSTIDKIIKTTLDKFGTMHILFNNAGYVSQYEGPLSVNGKVEGFDDMYRIYLRVPYMLIQGFIKELEKNKGVIINGSSGYSDIADPGMTCYSTMKAGMDHFTEILAVELAMKGVRVNSVNPGFVKTDIGRIFGDAADLFWESRCLLTPFEHTLATPESIADVVAFLASDMSSSMSGTIVKCDRLTTMANPVIDKAFL